MDKSIDTCPICGGERFSWGTLMDVGGNGPVGFRPNEDSVLRSMFSSPLPVRVRRCLECNNLQQFLSDKGTK